MNKTLFLILASGLLFHTACSSDTPRSSISADPALYTLEVPSDYSRSNSPKITIEFAVRKTKSASRKGAMLWLSGGPGQDVFSIESVIDQYASPADIRDNYDYVYINIRGVGKQATQINCPSARSFNDCLAEANSMVPLSSFSTTNAARDIDEVRKSIGIDRWASIYGQSYGTRLAQEYVKLFGANVQKVVLDGVVSPGAKLFSEDTPRYNQSLNNVFTTCENTPECKSLLPNDRFSDVFNRMLASAKDGKIVAPLTENIPSGDATTCTYSTEGVIGIDDSRLLQYVLLLLRSTEERVLIPKMVSEYQALEAAINAGPTTLKDTDTLSRIVNVLLRNSNIFGDFYDYVNVIMNCAESFPLDQVTDADLETIKADSGVFAPMVNYDDQKAQCNAVLSLIAESKREFTGDTVVSQDLGCVLNGQDDPVTPVEWAEAVHGGLAKATYALIPFEGHVVLPSECGRTLVAQCIDPTVTNVTTSCTNQVTSPYRTAPSITIASCTSGTNASSVAGSDAWAQQLLRNALRSGSPLLIQAAHSVVEMP